MNDRTCVHCSSECGITDMGEAYVNVCVNPECPNYGLLQVSGTKIQQYLDSLK